MKKILKRYQNNLDFIHQYDFKLYNQLLDLEKKLEKNQRYFLEHNGCFNIYDKVEKRYLLQSDTIYDAKYKAFQLDNSIKQSICLIQTNKIRMKKHFNYGINSYKFINQYINKIDFNNLKLKKYKFIFFGTILGEDVKLIVKKIKASSILFCEEDIELFRLSLFIVPYYKLIKNFKLYFAIGDGFIEKFEIFYNNNYKYNHYLKYHLVSNSSSLDKILSYVDINNPLMYSFSEYLGSYKRGLHYLNNGCKLLKFNNLLDGKKILYLGAGPSLEKEIEFVKKSQKRFIIVVVAATIKLLYKHNIRPDVIITIDGSKDIESQFMGISKKYLNNIPIITSLSLHKIMFKYLNYNNLYFIQTSNKFLNNLKNFEGYSSGDIGLSILLALSPKKIYLLGFDLAIVENISHISTHRENKIKNHSVEKYIFIKGNFMDSVKTLSRFLQIKLNIETIIKQYSNIDIYNLSLGVYIENTIPKSVNQILIKNKEDKKLYFESYKSDKIKKSSKIFFTSIKQYDKLLSPYNNLLKLQEKKDILKKKQIKKIKSYYEAI